MTKDWDLYYLGMAKYITRKSKDPSTKVGAVIVRPDKTQCSAGYNGFARGVHDTEERLHNRELKYPLTLHAEENAIDTARDPNLDGYTIYTYPFQPCSHCASRIINNGISEVVSIRSDVDRWSESFRLAVRIFLETGVTLKFYYMHELNNYLENQ